jgi:hypothetical protein
MGETSSAAETTTIPVNVALSALDATYGIPELAAAAALA